MMNDELPVPPEMHVNPRRGYRPMFCCAYLVVLILMIIAVASIAQLAGRPDPRDEQYDRLLARLKKLEDSCATQVRLRAELANVEQHSDTKIADVKANVREMSAMMARKKRLVDVPLALMVDAGTAHDMMMNGDIMRDEYRAFAAQQHNMDVGTMARQFLKGVKVVVFNMHYVNRAYGVQLVRSFGYVYVIPNITLESYSTDVHCKYMSVMGPGTYTTYPLPFTELITLGIDCSNYQQCRGWSSEEAMRPFRDHVVIAQVC